MAIVFISPKEKQKTFFQSILMLLILVLLVIAFIFFFPALLNKIQRVPVQVSYNKPNVIINLDIIHSAKFNHLTPFNVSVTGFSYIVKEKNGRQIAGNISAASMSEAQRLLEASGFTVISLKEMVSGRSNPFISY